MLVVRFRNILTSLNCGFAVRVDNSKDYCSKIAELYEQQYSWYYMSASVHIILVHIYKIIEDLGTPTGSLSEEAQESAHKFVKLAKNAHSTKINR